MKINLHIDIDSKKLPKDYRRGFISIIKAALSEEGKLYYEQFYGDKVNKPFTFSVYFQELQGANGEYINVGNKATLNFSSNDPQLIAYIYNGTRKVKTHQWKENTFKITNVSARFNRPIKNDHCIFKTISPFLINQKGDNLQYLTPSDEGFDDGFRFAIGEICEHFLGIEDIDLDYKILKHKKMVVSHYNQSMTCNKGIIEMKAHPKVLDLLYNVGIGVRRSQGFGMVELIK